MSNSRRNSLRRNSLRSSSLAPPNAAELQILKDFQVSPIKVDVKTIDMEPTLQQRVESLTIDAFEACSSEREVAAHIRKDLDKLFGKTWNVVVGRHFGSDVTHESKKYIHLQYGHLNILIWKCGGDAAVIV